MEQMIGHKRLHIWAACPFCRKTFEVNQGEHVEIQLDGKRRFVCGTCAPRVLNPGLTLPPTPKGNGNDTTT
jgi:hypothetical protein